MIRTWLSTAVAALAVAVGMETDTRADGPAPDWNAAPATTPLSVKPPTLAPGTPSTPEAPTQWVPAVTPATPPPAPRPPAAAPTNPTDVPDFRAIQPAPTPPPAPAPTPTAAPALPALPAAVPTSVPLPTPDPEFRPITPAPAPAPVAPPLPAPTLPAPTLPAPSAPIELPPVPADPPRQLLPTRLPSLSVPPMQAPPDEPKKTGPISEPLPPPRPAPTTPPEPAKVPPLTPAPQTVVVNPAAGMPAVDARPILDPAPNLPGAVPGTLNGVPVRGKVFGSPPVRLSRDFAARDFLGYDLADAPQEPRPRLFGPGSGSPPTDNYFVEAEYLLWWTSRPRIPVLATTTNNGGQGFVGQSGTVNLLGPGTFGPSFRDGLRVRVGGWLDDCSGHGFDASYFFLGRREESVTFSGLPTLTRPFFSPNFNAEFGEVVALPNLSTGSLRVETDSFLWGADINYRCAVCRTCDRTSAWFAGYRHLNLAETLSLTEDITATGALATDPVGTRVVVGDRFRTHNRFHGGQAGYLIEQRYGRWEVGLRASVALGVTVQTLEIDGFQRRTRPGQATQFFNGGLLATGPNLGRFDSTRFSVVPEATVSLGYFVTPNVQLTFGYNFFYWNNVIRPGDQIDRTVDVTLVPNPPAGVQPSGQNRPLPTFTQSDFWAQGISFGLRYRW